MNNTASLRFRSSSEAITDYLSRVYPNIVINTVFGFSEQCTLYGGRLYKQEITDTEIAILREQGIYFRIPLTSFYVNDETYNSAQEFLIKHHILGNSVIVANHWLGEQIRKDFPLYTIELSVIIDLKSVDEVNKYTEIYDEVVLHGQWNKRYESLKKIVRKDRIRLFTAMACSYNCPDRSCYKHVSQKNSGIYKQNEMSCSQSFVQRQDLGIVNFSVAEMQALGFTKFKFLPIQGT